MGLFDFFRGRRERESAIPSAPPAPADPGDVIGQPLQGSPASSFDLGDAATGSIDLRGSGELREEIVAIMQRHGIDPESGATTGAQIDAGSIPGMQEEILAALSRHGLNVSAEDVRIEPSGSDQRSG